MAKSRTVSGVRYERLDRVVRVWDRVLSVVLVVSLLSSAVLAWAYVMPFAAEATLGLTPVDFGFEERKQVRVISPSVSHKRVSSRTRGTSRHLTKSKIPDAVRRLRGDAQAASATATSTASAAVNAPTTGTKLRDTTQNSIDAQYANMPAFSLRATA